MRALYYGGLGPPFPLTGSIVFHPSVDATLSEWVRHDGCNTMPTETMFIENGRHMARQLVYGNYHDGAEVVLWKLTGAGHGWPNGKPRLERLVGPPTKIIDANKEIWHFFRDLS